MLSNKTTMRSATKQAKVTLSAHGTFNWFVGLDWTANQLQQD